MISSSATRSIPSTPAAPTMTAADVAAEADLLFLDSQVRVVLAKQGQYRSYDDLLTLKARLSRMDYMKSTFSQLHPRQVDELCRNMNLETAEENQIIFRQGDVGDKFYVILTGCVNVQVRQKIGTFIDSEGKEQDEYRQKVLFQCTAGQQFGERALEFDEPRGATIQATTHTELISLTKAVYLKIVRSKVDDSQLNKPGNKGHTIRVLSKTRDKRTTPELEAVAKFLSKRIPFFRRFTHDHQIELCRMCELVNIWGKTTLFKQDSIGQAFYIILSGSVSVIVTTTDAAGNSVDMVVNTLYEGASFGERALESESSVRTATIVTNDALNELLIISREEYLRIVAIIQQDDLMQRVSLLRRTQVFNMLDLAHLFELAKIMEPKIFRCGEKVISAGDVGKDMFIIHKGECRVAGKLQLSAGHVKGVDLGRLGPGAVIGEYCVSCDNYHDEVKYRESISAATYCCAFVVAKHDIFNTLSTPAYTTIIAAIRNFVPSDSCLWDDSPKIVTEQDYLLGLTWKSFKSEVVDKKDQRCNILDSYRHSAAAMTSPRDKSPREHLPMIPKAQEVVLSNSAPYPLPLTSSSHGNRKSPRRPHHPKHSSGSAEPTPRKHSSGGAVTMAPTNVPFENRSRKFSIIAALKHLQAGGETKSNPTQHEKNTLPTILRHPFALVHLHREKVKVGQGNKVSKRLVQCFVRFAGLMKSGDEAKQSAEAQILNTQIKLRKADEARTDDNLTWSRFTSYANMPLHYTDHFIVFCRSVPVEFSSFSPGDDLMKTTFPPSCKPQGQRFACVSMRDLKKSSLVTDSAMSSMEEISRPLYNKEVSSIIEVHAVSSKRIDALRYAVLHLFPTLSAASADTRLLVVPLYNWYQITEDMMDSFDCMQVSKQQMETKENGKKIHMNISTLLHGGHDENSIAKAARYSEKDVTGKEATEELKATLESFGYLKNQNISNLSSSQQQAQDDDEEDAPNLFHDAEMNKLLEAVKHRSQQPNAMRSLKTEETVKAPKPVAKTTELDSKRRIYKELIDSRRRVLDMNDNLCVEEYGEMQDELDEYGTPSKQRDNKKKKKHNVYTSLAAKRLQKKKTHDENIAELSEKRLEVLVALQDLPLKKTVEQTVRNQIEKEQTRGMRGEESKKPQRGLAQFLTSKLSILDDMIEEAKLKDINVNQLVYGGGLKNK